MTDPVPRRRPDAVVGTLPSVQLERLRILARVLDNALRIPGTRYRFGLDALIGLVPGIGDAIGAIFSTFIIWQAARLGVPNATLVRMVANVGVDTLVGEIPLLGDLFDFAWKSNTMNLNLLEAHLQRPAAARRANQRALLLLGTALLLLFVGAIAIGILVANYVLNLTK